MKIARLFLPVLFIVCFSCGKKQNPPQEEAPSFNNTAITVDGASGGFSFTNVDLKPAIKFSFSEAIKQSSISTGFSFKDKATGNAIAFASSLENDNTTVTIKPSAPLQPLSGYTLTVSKGLQSQRNGPLRNVVSVSLSTGIDTSDKFPRISDEALLDLVQRQTFRYFYDFADPVSGMARERNTSGDVVTTGGSGFGIMSLIVGVERDFITRSEGLSRLEKIINFLNNKAQVFHGAFPHWLNGTTGVVVPFSEKDDGADLVETSYLMQGLLTARQYFNHADAVEANLRDSINRLWEAVEWDWFRKNNENVLYWHYSPNYEWQMNVPVKGWNEALITYVLAASSPTHPIPKIVYDEGWASNGTIRNGHSYYDLLLPLGPSYGGPLFFSHYSFLGINPNGLSDAYADYETQTVSHSRINHLFCVENPNGFTGYGDSCWGLTASDDNREGYVAHSPTNDDGVISPTAALSSFPYTSEESMKALHFFYYKLGDRIWKEYGFTDAFNLTDKWFSDSFLAIDQGPIIIMIENYRSRLLWNLFMSCPEVKSGLLKLGFQSPNL